MVVSGITTGKENTIQVRTAFVIGVMPCNFFPEFNGIGQIDIRRDPVPMIQTIRVTYLTDLIVHHIPRIFHQGIVFTIMKRNVLDAVGSEKCQFAQVFFILIHGPCIPGVCCVAIPDLMAPNGVFWRGRNLILFGE
jgi:hypothetical protein